MDIELVTKLAGFLGVALVFAAYFPQMRHIVLEHCSAGVSERAYVMWLVASILLLVQALAIGAIVFIILQLFQIFVLGFTLFLTHRYENGTCASHKSSAKK